MTYYLKSGTRFNVSTKEALDLHDKLPGGHYTVKFNQQAGVYYLEQIEGFEIKGKVYGASKRTASRILNTFKSRTNSTGVMLTGEKGSGKTMLAKLLSLEALEEDIPTIVINQPHCGEEFNGFMQMIEQPAIVVFDEFEKVYDHDKQESLLTLLDGVYPSKKLFVLTCNNVWRVNEHMRNRPGRIYYMLDFKGLDQTFIQEYCEDTLVNKEHIPAICRISTVFDQFNFDMLKALVEEMNRYNETPQEAMAMLNARPDYAEASSYNIVLQPKGLDIDPDLVEDTKWHGNPMTNLISIDFKQYEETGDSEDVSDWNWETCQFTTEDLKQVDSATGKFLFINAKGDRITLSKVKPRSFKFDAI